MLWRRYALPGTILAGLLLFVVYPAFSVFYKSLLVHGRLGWGNYVALFTQPHLRRTVWASLLMATASATCSTLLGLILALVAFKSFLPLRRLFVVTAMLPMIIPGFVNALSYIFLFGRNGLITYRLLGISWEIYSWRSVFILQSLDFTTTTFLLIAAVLVGVGDQMEDAARNLGADEWQVLTTVTLPLIRPGLMSALLLAFLRSMADFGTPFIVGGGFTTLATASYTQLIGTYNTEMASTQSVILLLCCLLVFGLYARVQRQSLEVRPQTHGTVRKPLALVAPLRWGMWGVSLLFSLVILMLLVAVFLAAFTKHLGGNMALTLAHLRTVSQQGWNSTRNTLLFAIVTSLMMSFLGIVIAYLVTRGVFRTRRLIDLLATLPFAIPGTFMGVGYALAFNRPPLLLSGTWAIVVACTVIRELPLGVRAASSVLVQQDPAIEEASANLGASRLTTFWRIVVPLVRPALLVSALYAFVSTVKTLGAIIFLITPHNKVLSADVFEATVRGDVGAAASFSLLMVLLCALGVVAIYVLSKRETSQTWIRKVLVGRIPG